MCFFFFFWRGCDVNNDFLLMNNQTQHLSNCRPQDTLSVFTLNPVLQTFFYPLVQPATLFSSYSMLKYVSLCATHSVEWKEQTISFHPSGLGVALWCPWGFPSILSLLNPTSWGPFPILVKEYVSECLLCKVLQRSIWAVWTSGKLPKSLRSPSIPQESWKRAAAKHMSLSHELGDQYHTTAAVHSSLWPDNSCFSLCPSLVFSPVVSTTLPPPPVRAHTFSLKLRVSLSVVCIASSVITGASLLARCSGYPCRHGWIQTFLWFFSKMIGWETAIPDILEQQRFQNGFKILLDKKLL